MTEATTAQRLALHGGQPAAQRIWPSWPVWDDTERSALSGVLESGKWWYGENVRQFEERYAAFHHVKYAVSCTSGTTALEMALRAVGIVAGDEVILPPYTFIGTATAVACLGAVPVFADIDPETLCIDPEDVRRKITPRTKAIVPVHVGGTFADIDGLSHIARRHGLRIVEDAAHAWGSLLRGQGPGAVGDCATFSFQQTKNITCGEGGILLTNDAELAALARSFSDSGRTEDDGGGCQHGYLGSNLRMTEFQAALLLAQLSRLEEQIARRERSAAILDAELGAVPGIRLTQRRPEMTRRSYHMYIFRLDTRQLGITRDPFVEALNAEGVPALAGWSHPLYTHGLFRNAGKGPLHGVRSPFVGANVRYEDVSCPVCEEVCRDAVWIPQNVLLATDNDMGSIAAAVRKVVDGRRELR